MRRLAAMILVSWATLALTGCVASMAASAVGMAVTRGGRNVQGNEQLRPLAVKACSARAGQYGTVHVIDVEQRAPNKIIIWGTVEDKDQRRAFECAFGTAISGFKIHTIVKKS